MDSNKVMIDDRVFSQLVYHTTNTLHPLSPLLTFSIITCIFNVHLIWSFISQFILENCNKSRHILHIAHCVHCALTILLLPAFPHAFIFHVGHNYLALAMILSLAVIVPFCGWVDEIKLYFAAINLNAQKHIPTHTKKIIIVNTKMKMKMPLHIRT